MFSASSWKLKLKENFTHSTTLLICLDSYRSILFYYFFLFNRMYAYTWRRSTLQIEWRLCSFTILVFLFKLSLPIRTLYFVTPFFWEMAKSGFICASSTRGRHTCRRISWFLVDPFYNISENRRFPNWPWKSFFLYFFILSTSQLFSMTLVPDFLVLVQSGL